MGSSREVNITDQVKFQCPRDQQVARSGKEKYNASILVLRLICSARADNIGYDPEMRLDRSTGGTERVMATGGFSKDHSGPDARYVRRRILRFSAISDVYLRVIVSRSIIISLSIDAILWEVTFRWREKKLKYGR